jgi:hypothetical protein
MTKMGYQTSAQQHLVYTLSGNEHCTNPRIIHENLCYEEMQQDFFQQGGAYNQLFSVRFS